MATNKILEFCGTDTGTNLLTDAEYAADSQRPIGNQPGVARSKLVNKALLQTSLMASALAQTIVDLANTDVSDDMSVADIAALLESTLTSGSAPLGAAIEYYGATLPSGHLWMDGSIHNIADFPALAAVLGNTFGGNGTTTFGVPDKRGRVGIGKDDMGGTAANRITNAVAGFVGTTLGASGGDQRMQGHTHTITDPGHVHTVTPGVTNQVASTGGNPMYYQGAATNTGSSTTGITINSSGAGSSQNVQPGIICNFIMRTGS